MKHIPIYKGDTLRRVKSPPLPTEDVKKFRELKEEWYSRLRESGFRDVETLSGMHPAPAMIVAKAKGEGNPYAFWATARGTSHFVREMAETLKVIDSLNPAKLFTIVAWNRVLGKNHDHVERLNMCASIVELLVEGSHSHQEIADSMGTTKYMVTKLSKWFFTNYVNPGDSDATSS